MEINNFIAPEDVFVGFSANSKKHVLEEMVRFAATRVEGIDQRAVLEMLTERERIGCTGIGNGVAIPHTRCELPATRTAPLALLAVLDKPIDFNTSDGVPVDIVFMLLAPANCGGEHLTVLAMASRLLSSPHTAKALRRSTSNEEAWFALSSGGDPSRTAA